MDPRAFYCKFYEELLILLNQKDHQKKINDFQQNNEQERHIYTKTFRAEHWPQKDVEILTAAVSEATIQTLKYFAFQEITQEVQEYQDNIKSKLIPNHVAYIFSANPLQHFKNAIKRDKECMEAEMQLEKFQQAKQAPPPVNRGQTDSFVFFGGAVVAFSLAAGAALVLGNRG